MRYLTRQDEDVRLASQANLVAPMIFVVPLAVLTYFVVSIWREGTADTRRPKSLGASRQR